MIKYVQNPLGKNKSIILQNVMVALPMKPSLTIWEWMDWGELIIKFQTHCKNKGVDSTPLE